MKSDIHSFIHSLLIQLGLLRPSQLCFSFQLNKFLLACFMYLILDLILNINSMHFPRSARNHVTHVLQYSAQQTRGKYETQRSRPNTIIRCITQSIYTRNSLSHSNHSADRPVSKLHVPDELSCTVLPSSSNFIRTCSTPCDAGRWRFSGTPS